MNPAAFFETLWARDPRGLLAIWTMSTKRSTYFRAPAGTVALAGQDDVFFSVALAGRDAGATRRPKREDAIALPGLWADVDLPRDDALTLAHVIAEPTLLISSGTGVHAYWLFREPWYFASRDAQQAAAIIAAQWQALHRAKALELGHGLDSTHDLARLLRLPGTFNTKRGGREPVEVIARGPRHDRAWLMDWCEQAGRVDVEVAAGVGGPAEDRPQVSVGGDLDSDRLKQLIAFDEDFAATWQHRRHKRRDGSEWSMSEYDMALVSIAADAGWTDQQLADLISAHRRAWGDDAKARRADYVRRTIARVRAREAEPDRVAARELADRFTTPRERSTA